MMEGSKILVIPCMAVASRLPSLYILRRSGIMRDPCSWLRGSEKRVALM